MEGLFNYYAGLSLCHFLNDALFQTAGADFDRLDGAVVVDLDLLQIRLPTAIGLVVGMADVVAKLRLLATNFTYLRHSYSPLKSGHNLNIALEITNIFFSRCGKRRRSTPNHFVIAIRSDAAFSRPLCSAPRELP